MARHKHITHLLASPSPAPPPSAPPAPRLVVQLFVVMGELLAIAVFALGAGTSAAALCAGCVLTCPLRPMAQPHQRPENRLPETFRP